MGYVAAVSSIQVFHVLSLVQPHMAPHGPMALFAVQTLCKRRKVLHPCFKTESCFMPLDVTTLGSRQEGYSPQRFGSSLQAAGMVPYDRVTNSRLLVYSFFILVSHEIRLA